MGKIDRILVVIDAEADYAGEPAGLPVALRKALRFVHSKRSVQLHLLGVAYKKYLHHPFHSIGYDHKARRKELLERLHKNLETLAAPLRESGFEIKADVVWGHPHYEQVVKKATAIDADLVVQSARAQARIEHLHLTNDSWQLVRMCKQPLLLVKDADWSERPVLMAAVDPLHSHHKPLRLDNRILDTALEMSAQVGGDLHVVHAYGESARPFAVAGKIREEHSQAFDALLSDYTFDTSKIHFIDETPLYALQQFGEQVHCDILVMGALSRSRLSEALIGSTAEQALDYIKTDVLIVKPRAG